MLPCKGHDHFTKQTTKLIIFCNSAIQTWTLHCDKIKIVQLDWHTFLYSCLRMQSIPGPVTASHINFICLRRH